jgi:hypothetical protein
MIPTTDIDAEDIPVVHCDCQCPFWQKQHDHFYGVTCLQCGEQEITCGYCLETGRAVECLQCARARRYSEEVNGRS